MTNINTAEKIETIVGCFLRNRTTSGAFGTLVEVEAFPELGVLPGWRVVADGKTFIVRTDTNGWCVQFGPVTGCDPDVYLAAKFAIDSRDVGTVAQALGWTK